MSSLRFRFLKFWIPILLVIIALGWYHIGSSKNPEVGAWTTKAEENSFPEEGESEAQHHQQQQVSSIPKKQPVGSDSQNDKEKEGKQRRRQEEHHQQDQEFRKNGTWRSSGGGKASFSSFHETDEEETLLSTPKICLLSLPSSAVAAVVGKRIAPQQGEEIQKEEASIVNFLTTRRSRRHRCVYALDSKKSKDNKNDDCGVLSLAMTKYIVRLFLVPQRVSGGVKNHSMATCSSPSSSMRKEEVESFGNDDEDGIGAFLRSHLSQHFYSSPSSHQSNNKHHDDNSTINLTKTSTRQHHSSKSSADLSRESSSRREESSATDKEEEEDSLLNTCQSFFSRKTKIGISTRGGAGKRKEGDLSTIIPPLPKAAKSMRKIVSKKQRQHKEQLSLFSEMGVGGITQSYQDRSLQLRFFPKIENPNAENAAKNSNEEDDFCWKTIFSPFLLSSKSATKNQEEMEMKSGSKENDRADATNQKVADGSRTPMKKSEKLTYWQLGDSHFNIEGLRQVIDHQQHSETFGVGFLSDSSCITTLQNSIRINPSHPGVIEGCRKKGGQTKQKSKRGGAFAYDASSSQLSSASSDGFFVYCNEANNAKASPFLEYTFQRGSCKSSGRPSQQTKSSKYNDNVKSLGTSADDDDDETKTTMGSKSSNRSRPKGLHVVFCWDYYGYHLWYCLLALHTKLLRMAALISLRSSSEDISTVRSTTTTTLEFHQQATTKAQHYYWDALIDNYDIAYVPSVLHQGLAMEKKKQIYFNGNDNGDGIIPSGGKNQKKRNKIAENFLWNSVAGSRLFLLSNEAFVPLKQRGGWNRRQQDENTEKFHNETKTVRGGETTASSSGAFEYDVLSAGSIDPNSITAQEWEAFRVRLCQLLFHANENGEVGKNEEGKTKLRGENGSSFKTQQRRHQASVIPGKCLRPLLKCNPEEEKKKNVKYHYLFETFNVTIIERKKNFHIKNLFAVKVMVASTLQNLTFQIPSLGSLSPSASSLWRLAKNLQVKVAIFEEMSQKEQLEVGFYSQILIGIHGNGLTWSGMMHPRDAALIEIWPAQGYNGNYFSFAQKLHLHYERIEHTLKSASAGGGKKLRFDTFVNLWMLKNSLIHTVIQFFFGVVVTKQNFGQVVDLTKTGEGKQQQHSRIMTRDDGFSISGENCLLRHIKRTRRKMKNEHFSFDWLQLQKISFPSSPAVEGEQKIMVEVKWWQQRESSVTPAPSHQPEVPVADKNCQEENNNTKNKQWRLNEHQGGEKKGTSKSAVTMYQKEKLVILEWLRQCRKSHLWEKFGIQKKHYVAALLFIKKQPPPSSSSSMDGDISSAFSSFSVSFWYYNFFQSENNTSPAAQEEYQRTRLPATDQDDDKKMMNSSSSSVGKEVSAPHHHHFISPIVKNSVLITALARSYQLLGISGPLLPPFSSSSLVDAFFERKEKSKEEEEHQKKVSHRQVFIAACLNCTSIYSPAKKLQCLFACVIIHRMVFCAGLDFPSTVFFQQVQSAQELEADWEAKERSREVAYVATMQAEFFRSSSSSSSVIRKWWNDHIAFDQYNG